MRLAYTTNHGSAYIGDSLELLDSLEDNSINLVMTSPPFALLRQKAYGNKNGEEYIEWLSEFAVKVKDKLTEDGSFVLDLGGAYQKGFPTRSLYNYKVLIKFVEELGFHLAEEFFWFNPSKLPSPIEWVNKRKIRAKDAVNTVWWFSKSEFPKADVRKVLTPYSERMQKLLKDGKKYYDPKERPSGHNISEGFNKDNGGAIPPNLLQFPNSESNSKYLALCKSVKVKGHPARFPGKLPEFFIKFLTDENDIVLDIFGGSNTTGEMAQLLNRRWISCDIEKEYVAASSFRFLNDKATAKEVFDRIMNDETVDIGQLTLI
ncbi:site-specific DNA-methyltransferase (cytosine-N4-specific) [Bacillus subtilis J27]|uniref:DNA-methyltransferase n=1 Tax=Bacillus subtilis TaxID=1423 RepID=UPI0011A54831|nr:site-specific DNA-methyltransferase [Bacillus subtilis]TWG74400.1 site-specific DNA-methyltransferase (cytosine-N4-specific) [Bacillus subtilis J27]